MAIKMRVNYDTNSVCQNCGRKYMSTEVMHDVYFVDKSYTLCYDCIDVIFQKILTAQCNWSSKVKDKSDMARINNANVRKYPKITVEETKLPECYGNFVKEKKCRKCPNNKECKDVWQNSGWED